MGLTPWPLRFGAFFAPFHPAGQNPTWALEYDLERAVWLDRFGFEEVWFGEHHSAGYELIAMPEIMIALAAERTRHIKLGTGVVSLPYHHPLMVADRWVQLDHLTRGRAIFGVGPGALPSDAYMMGLDYADLRPRMEEALEAILALLAAEKPVDRKTDWFTLREARLQIRPFSHPCFEVATAAMVSPTGPRLAGKFGTSLLSLSMMGGQGMQVFAAVRDAWGLVEEEARHANRSADRRSWRLLGMMHLAPTRDQALEDLRFGAPDFAKYFGGGGGFVPLGPGQGARTPDEVIEAYRDNPMAVIGTPDQAIEFIENLIDASGGFGTFLMLGHDWADREATLRSYELFARKVIPHFKRSSRAQVESHDWATANREQLFGGFTKAFENAAARFHAEREARARKP